MRRSWKTTTAALALSVGVGGIAHAHDLTVTADCSVVGPPTTATQTLDITKYPSTVDCTFKVCNANPTTDSTLTSITDPILSMIGGTFTPPAPQTVPHGGCLTYMVTGTVTDIAQCGTLAAADNDPNTPGTPPNVAFTNTVTVSWDTGSASANTGFVCHPPANMGPPPFTCDPSIYFSSAVAIGNGLLGVLDPMTGALTPPGGLLGISLLGSLGYNPVNNFLYGVAGVTVGPITLSHLFQIGSDFVPHDLGAITGLDALAALWTGGTFLPDGTFLALAAGVGPGLGLPWAKINVTTSPPSVIASGTLPLTTVMIDWAYNPADGKVYGYNNLTHKLAQFDPASGTTTDVGPVFPTGPLGLPNLAFLIQGAAFDSTGKMYLYGTDLLTLSINALFSVPNIAAPVVTKLTNGPLGINAGLATCINAPTVPSTTRDVGFYAAHEKPVSDCFDKGAIDLGKLGKLASTDEALALLWSDPLFDEHGNARSAVDTARIDLGRAVVAGTCNHRLFGAGAVYQQMISDGAAALTSDDQVRMKGALGNLAPANDAGAKLAVPALYIIGPATPAHAASFAPTSDKR